MIYMLGSDGALALTRSLSFDVLNWHQTDLWQFNGRNDVNVLCAISSCFNHISALASAFH